jgi:hypothetical protein
VEELFKIENDALKDVLLKTFTMLENGPDYVVGNCFFSCLQQYLKTDDKPITLRHKVRKYMYKDSTDTNTGKEMLEDLVYDETYVENNIIDATAACFKIPIIIFGISSAGADVGISSYCSVNTTTVDRAGPKKVNTTTVDRAGPKKKRQKTSNLPINLPIKPLVLFCSCRVRQDGSILGEHYNTLQFNNDEEKAILKGLAHSSQPEKDISLHDLVNTCDDVGATVFEKSGSIGKYMPYFFKADEKLKDGVVCINNRMD